MALEWTGQGGELCCMPTVGHPLLEAAVCLSPLCGAFLGAAFPAGMPRGPTQLSGGWGCLRWPLCFRGLLSGIS